MLGRPTTTAQPRPPQPDTPPPRTLSCSANHRPPPPTDRTPLCPHALLPSTRLPEPAPHPSSSFLPCARAGSSPLSVSFLSGFGMKLPSTHTPHRRSPRPSVRAEPCQPPAALLRHLTNGDAPPHQVSAERSPLSRSEVSFAPHSIHPNVAAPHHLLLASKSQEHSLTLVGYRGPLAADERLCVASRPSPHRCKVPQWPPTPSFLARRTPLGPLVLDPWSPPHLGRWTAAGRHATPACCARSTSRASEPALAVLSLARLIGHYAGYCFHWAER
jgi:hypothetical protein